MGPKVRMGRLARDAHEDLGVWPEARRLATRQHGVLTRRQLLELGAGSGAIKHRMTTGELVALHRGVYRLGPVLADKAHEIAAVLACGERSCVSHESATYLQKLPPYPARPASVHVTVVARHGPSRPGIAVHRVASLTRGEVTHIEGIPTTTPTRTILDLTPTLDPQALEHLLAEAYAKRLTTRASLIALLDRYPRRPGTRALRRLLDAGRDPARTRSNPERRLLALIRKARLPEPQVNARLCGWEVDFLWPEHRLVVEVDALSTHTSPRDFERDRRKDAELVIAGYTVIRVTKRQLQSEPYAVVARIAQAFASLSPSPPSSGSRPRPS